MRSYLTEPFYEAASGTPLKPDQKLVIGTGDNDTYFHHRDNKDYDFFYLKIFVARDPMEFRFIRQSYFSSSEDRLRRFDLGITNFLLATDWLELFRRQSASWYEIRGRQTAYKPSGAKTPYLWSTYAAVQMGFHDNPHYQWLYVKDLKNIYCCFRPFWFRALIHYLVGLKAAASRLARWA